MAKYNYDKTALKDLGVGAFLKETKVREQHIAEGENTIPTSVYNPNVIASKLHPAVQYGKIIEVIEHADAKTFKIAPNEDMGCNELAYFRAGQYVSIDMEFGGAFMSKPYALSSNPKDALKNNVYSVTVKKNKNGYSSDYVLSNWGVGTSLTMSGPLGDFYYEPLRDAKNVVALAGGSGITPIASMAQAIADGVEDFNLTILYGSTKHDVILLKDLLDDCVSKSNGKIKVVHVLSDEEVEGYEHGFITAELIKKYAPEGDYSVFVCGPKAMYNFVEGEIAKIGLPIRRVRYELAGEYGDPSKDEEYPKDSAGKTYKVKVVIHGNETEIECKAEESLLHAMETAGIKAPSQCRSGICGWCHSRLISGKVYVPKKADGRRLADKKFGWIHPCASYPLSDIEIEVFPIVR